MRPIIGLIIIFLPIRVSGKIFLTQKRREACFDIMRASATPLGRVQKSAQSFSVFEYFSTPLRWLDLAVQ
jgi:hypothetical protein